MLCLRRIAVAILLVLLSLSTAAQSTEGFTGTDLIVPAAGRVQGADGSVFTTSVWVTNPNDVPVTFELRFLQTGQPNPNPATASDTIGPGETKVYENAAQGLFGLTGVLGAIRIVSSDELLISARVFSLAPNATPNEARGLIYSAIPASFGIGSGETSLLQGVNQGGEYRYNVFLVESSGQPASVTLRIRDASGTVVSTTTQSLGAYEQRLIGVGDLWSIESQGGCPGSSYKECPSGSGCSEGQCLPICLGAA